MSDPRIETLERLHAAHGETGDVVDALYEALQKAINAEDVIGNETVAAYKAAFAGGIVIKQVLDKDNLIYLAGSEERLAHGFVEREQVWLPVDESHAETLRNAVVTDSFIDIWFKYRDVSGIASRLPISPQAGLGVGFHFGEGHNDSLREGILPLSHEEAGGTHYMGKLAAIEWRLPTEDEVQAFGAVATSGAQVS